MCTVSERIPSLFNFVGDYVNVCFFILISSIINIWFIWFFNRKNNSNMTVINQSINQLSKSLRALHLRWYQVKVAWLWAPAHLNSKAVLELHVRRLWQFREWYESTVLFQKGCFINDLAQKLCSPSHIVANCDVWVWPVNLQDVALVDTKWCKSDALLGTARLNFENSLATELSDNLNIFGTFRTG